jgi:hypothetical protein
MSRTDVLLMAPLAGSGHSADFPGEVRSTLDSVAKVFLQHGHKFSELWARRSDNNVRGYFIL